MERAVVLIVAMPDSVHTARWLAPLRNAPFVPVLLPVSTAPPTPELEPLVRIDRAEAVRSLPRGTIAVWDAGLRDGPPDSLPPPIGERDRSRLVRGSAIGAAIRSLRPAMIHSMEVQQAGYACLAAARALGRSLPRWLLSNWGSDISLYRKLALHQPILAELAGRADAYLGECARDLALVRELGFAGVDLAAIPASCGADFTRLPDLATLAPPSRRDEILVKGYHGWSGRAQHVLSAIHLAAPALAGFRIRVALPEGSVWSTVDMLRARDGLDIRVEPFTSAHEQALERIARARMTIGIGISDGIGTTTLEAMALGSFPITANTACTNEWIVDGRDGFITDPHDVAAMADVIVRASRGDPLVDRAARRNRAEVESRWNATVNGRRILALYDSLLARWAQQRTP